MKAMLWTVAAAAALGAAAAASAQTMSDLLADGNTPGNVLVHGMGYADQSYSPLSQINTGNVRHLVPVWTQSLGDDMGEEAMPVLYDGVLYVTTHNATVAIDALSGRQLWKNTLQFASDVPRVVCCGEVNRGVAIYDGMVYRGTLDAQIQALDAKTGKQLWETKLADYKQGYSVTGAPLMAHGVLITGMSGAEYGTRGFLKGLDPKTGKVLWTRYTTAAPGEPGGDTWTGDTYLKGGGSTWVTGSYDPKLDLVYWGTGNAGPWNPTVRKGDNLYTASVLAIRPETGKIVWYYQFTPNDMFDYDGVNELVQADLKVDGKMHKVIMQANRNGFLYVIDRTDGKLLAAHKFVPKVTWASGIDLKTGRPIETDVMADARAGKKVEVWPGALGAKNWPPMSFDPGTGLVYANVINAGMPYQVQKPDYKPEQFYLGIDFTGFTYPKGPRGYLEAIDPVDGKVRWKVPRDIPSYSGVLTTGGGLVFSGTMTGEFQALDARSGKVLWSYRTGSASMSQPITWTHDGKQYVTALSGIGGVYPLFSGDDRLANVPAGGAVWTFAVQR
jgi:alcohol dehydrogenase (cytochrome c)